jgi:3-oxoadipate enol-lactonase
MPYAETNGIITFYEDTAATTGATALLVHGHSADLRMWDRQVDPLTTTGYRVIRYDVRGHGHSSAPYTGYSWENYSADLAGLLDHLAIEPVHLVGSSMGGAICLQFTVDYPGRVVSLTLVDSALPGFTYSEEFSSQIEALVAAAREEGPWPAFKRLWLTHPMFDGVRSNPEALELVTEMVRAFPAMEYRGGQTSPEDYEQPQLTDRLHEITAPALVITGENDITDFQIIAEILAAHIPNAERHSFSGCWHLPMIEKPGDFNARLVAFLRSHS